MGTSVSPCPADPIAFIADYLRRVLSGRGLHSFTFQLNLSALNGIGGARRGFVARGKGVLAGL